MCHIPFKMLKKMQFQTQVYGDYRFIHQKGEEKLGSEKWIICMQLTQQFYNFEFSAEDITSGFAFLLRLAGEYFYY